jgi:hypothetical protein
MFTQDFLTLFLQNSGAEVFYLRKDKRSAHGKTMGIALTIDGGAIIIYKTN